MHNAYSHCSRAFSLPKWIESGGNENFSETKSKPFAELLAMYGVSLKLSIPDTEKNHPKGFLQACTEIEISLEKYGFNKIQDGFYVNHEESMTNLFSAIQELKSLAWFPPSVQYISAFHIKQWSDFTKMVQS